MKNKATLLALLALCFSILSMAAGFTYTYRTDTPGASDDPREGDDRMREIKAALQERLTVDHYWSASAASTYDQADCGKHRWVTFQGPNTVSSVPENEGVLFTKDVSSKAELHFTDEDENEIQLTSAGTVKLSSASMLGVLANNTYLTAVDAAGTGTVDLIKATTGDVLQIPDGSVLATSAAPTTDAMIANKKYVDDAGGQSDVATGTTDISNNDNDWADMADMSVTMTTTGGNVLVQFTATFRSYTGHTRMELRMDLDGSPYCTQMQWLTTGSIDANSQRHIVTMHYLFTSVSAGSHTFKIQWNDEEDIIYQDGSDYPRVMSVIELP